jgi:hypothetical protein
VFLFDGLIEFEHDWHRDAWENDGRPSGYMFFRPPEAAWISLNTHFLFFSWLLRTPVWARQNKSCVRSLRWMRVLAVVWIAGIISGFRALHQTV